MRASSRPIRPSRCVNKEKPTGGNPPTGTSRWCPSPHRHSGKAQNPTTHPSSPTPIGDLAKAGTHGRGTPTNIRDKPPFTNPNTRSNITLSRFDKRCPCQPTLSDVTGDNSAVIEVVPHLVLKPVTTVKGRVRLWKRTRVKHGFPTPRPRGRTGKGMTLTCCQRGRGGQPWPGWPGAR